MHIEIETVWRFHKEGSPQTVVVMLGILNEIRKTGKITSAANDARLSYRHVWNLIEQWSEFFGAPLVESHRGRGTKLTAFGEKLVWAGQRMQARLGPQLENLAQELATEIKPFLHQRPSIIRVHASHGFAVSKLRQLLDREPGIGVDIALCEQSEFTDIAGAGGLRALRFAFAARRIACPGYRGLQGVARSA